MGERGLSLLWHLFVAGQRVKALLASAMTDSPLSPDEYAVYSLLMDGGPASPTQMARALGMPPTTMSHYVRAMLHRGHAERQPAAGDGRSYRLALTARGREAHAAARSTFQLANERFRAALDVDEAFLRRSLDEVGRAADAAAHDVAAQRRSAAG